MLRVHDDHHDDDTRPPAGDRPTNHGAPLITAIEIENFKGIGRPVRIELRPITLLFGRNSAGKSTVLHALCYAHEILSHRNADAHKTDLGGDQIDLGGFRRFVHGHDLKRSVRLRFELNLGGLVLPEPGGAYEAVRLGASLGAFPEVASLEEAEAGWLELKVAWKAELDKPIVSDYEVGVDGQTLGRIQVPSSGGTPTALANLSHPLLGYDVVKWNFLAERVLHPRPFGIPNGAPALHHRRRQVLNQGLHPPLLSIPVTAVSLLHRPPGVPDMPLPAMNSPVSSIRSRVALTSPSTCSTYSSSAVPPFDQHFWIQDKALDHRRRFDTARDLDTGTRPVRRAAAFRRRRSWGRSRRRRRTCPGPIRSTSVGFVSSSIGRIGSLVRDELAGSRYLGPLRDLHPGGGAQGRRPGSVRWADGSAAWELLTVMPGSTWIRTPRT